MTHVLVQPTSLLNGEGVYIYIVVVKGLSLFKVFTFNLEAEDSLEPGVSSKNSNGRSLKTTYQHRTFVLWDKGEATATTAWQMSNSNSYDYGQVCKLYFQSFFNYESQVGDRNSWGWIVD